MKVFNIISKFKRKDIAKKIRFSTHWPTGLKALQIIWDENQTNTGSIPEILLSDGYPINGIPTSTDWNTLLNNITVRLAAVENSNLPIGGWCFYDGYVLPDNFLWRNGAAVSRTTYDLLYAVSIQTIQGTTTGSSPVVTFGSPLPTNLYEGQEVECPNFTGVITIASIDSSTQITFSAPANSGSLVDFVFHLHGAGDGSTTFNVGDGCGRSPMGAGQGAGLTNRFPGQLLGHETEAPDQTQLTPHPHDLELRVLGSGGGGGFGLSSAEVGPGPTTVITENAGGGLPFSIIHPSEICNEIIRYR